MVGNTNIPIMVHNSNETTYTKHDEINDLNEDLLQLHNGLGDNINDANNENNHDDTNLANNRLKSNNPIDAHIGEEKKMVLCRG